MLSKRHIWTFVLCCYFATVLFLCLAKPQQVPGLEMTFWGIEADKIAHFLMFLPYPAIAYRAFRPAARERWRHIIVLAIIFAAGVGAATITEQLQGLSAYRSYETHDLYADVLGIWCMTIIISLLIIFNKQNRETDL